MDPTADELAGVADVFGALTRAELTAALEELAFKRGADLSDPAGAVDDAIDSYHLVGAVVDGERLLAPGPTAFPEIPEGGADLPHILDVPERDLDRARLAAAAAERFREEATVAVRSGDPDFVDRLLDVSYELETWGPVDVAGSRARLLDAQS